MFIKTETHVTAKVSLHDLIAGLENIAWAYPLDRLAPYQIERIETVARVLRERLEESKAAEEAGAPRKLRTIPTLPQVAPAPQEEPEPKNVEVVVKQEKSEGERLKENLARLQEFTAQIPPLFKLICPSVRLYDYEQYIKPTVCSIPPEGWACTRQAGHEGPCAAKEVF